MSKPRGTRPSPPSVRPAAAATPRAAFWPRIRPWAPALLVFGLALFCYWPALHGALLWDDPAHVTRPDLRSWDGLGRIWTDLGATQQYYPVLHSAFWVEHRLWGDRTFAYHLLNVILHAGSCCLLALLLRRLWSTPGFPAPPGAASRVVPAGAEWLAAILFAVHPLCVESVAWISEQKNTLSLVFYLLAGLTYLEFAADRRRRWYAAASVLFVLALGSKTMTVTLPAAMLVVLWWKNGVLSWRRDVVPLLPWFLLAAASGLTTAWVERQFVGAEGARFDLTAVQRVLLAARIVWFYLGKLVWPADLLFFYPRWNVTVTAAYYAWLGGAAAVTAALWLNRRRARGPLAGWLLFVGSLFPALGFFNVWPFLFSYVADHFQYLASLAGIAAAAAGAAVLLSRAPPWARVGGRVLIGAVLVVLAFEARGLSRLYRNNETLFGETVARNPRAWMAYQILGATFAKAPGRGAEAIACYQKVLEIDPNYPDAHMGLAVELARLPGRSAEAIAHYERAVQLRPNYVEAHNNLGVELAKVPGRLPDAIAEFEAALRLAPGFAEAHANLADALMQTPGRLPEAVTHCEAVVALRPGSAAAHYRLALLLAQIPGRASEAVAQGEAALRLRPNFPDALNALAIIHAQQGRLDQARACWEKALQLDPNFAPARQNLGLLEQMAAPGTSP